MLRDYKVRIQRSAREIEEVARRWRKLDRTENAARFDIVNFLFHVLPKYIEGRILNIRIRESLGVDAPAYVTHRTDRATGLLHTRIYIEKETLEHAKLGDPHSIYIIAHEIGHAVLHDAHCLRLSSELDVSSKAFEPEELAEWQAHQFGRALVAPRNVVISFNDADELRRYCNLTENCATQRMADIQELERFDRNSGSIACKNCGNFCINSINDRTPCDVCGNKN